MPSTKKPSSLKFVGHRCVSDAPEARLSTEQDFSELLKRMSACTICDGLELGPNPIFQIDQKAKILIVGQAPGRITHAKNRPFDDMSGNRLRRWLGVDRTTFYEDPRMGIFPMGLCFPGDGKGGDAPPRKECADTWRLPVLFHLQQVELTILMGRYAIDWHVPEHKRASVADAVSSIDPATAKNIILPHPSPRNMRWFKIHPWFDAEIIPALQKRVAAILSP